MSQHDHPTSSQLSTLPKKRPYYQQQRTSPSSILPIYYNSFSYYFNHKSALLHPVSRLPWPLSNGGMATNNPNGGRRAEDYKKDTTKCLNLYLLNFKFWLLCSPISSLLRCLVRLLQIKQQEKKKNKPHGGNSHQNPAFGSTLVLYWSPSTHSCS